MLTTVKKYRILYLPPETLKTHGVRGEAAMKRFREKTSDLIRRREFDRAWRRHCGYLDLSMDEFMRIQNRLLEEQLQLGKQHPLWQDLFGAFLENLTVENVRQLGPLTEYELYEPYLRDRPDNILARSIKEWARTSGLGGKPKWIPYTEEAYEHLGVCSITTGILSAAQERGDERIRPGDMVASNLPPRPYISGLALIASSEFFDYHFIPPLDITEKLSFHERTEWVFRQAMVDGLDILGAMTIVVVRMGEMFEQRERRDFSWQMLHPKALWRILRAFWRARQDGRTYILPKDLWPLKALQCGGTDTFLYRDKIKEYWGLYPYEIYACTEVGIMAAQAWGNHHNLIFLPDTAYYEFIPEEAWRRERLEGVTPTETKLMNELEEGKRYEVVITSFYGGALLRYRLHDLVQVVALEDKEFGIRLPQFQFVGRSGSFIDLSGFAGLIDEKLILVSLDRLSISYVDWTLRKEFHDAQPYLHLYIELKPSQSISAETLRDRLHETLKALDEEYGHVESMLGYVPLQVTLLSPGSFDRFIQYRLQQGADLAHLKPLRIQPSDEAIALLLEKNREHASGH